MRSGAKAGLIGGVFAIVAGGVGYGAYNVWTGINDTGGGGGDGSGTTQAAPVRTGPPSDDEISGTAKDFLAAWASGDADKASQLTNNATDSQPLLSGYRSDAHVSKVTLTPAAATGAKVPFTVKATISYEGKTKPWSYSSSLTVVRGLTTGKALVDWVPSVIHPDLKKGETIRTGEASSAPIKAVDRHGAELTKEKYPSLGAVLDALREKYGDKAGGKPGIETAIESTSGDASDSAPARTLVVLAKGKPALLHTTLDAGVQAAAETAVKQFSESSVAAVSPSTGEIRAVANNRTDGFNAAMQGKLAPGSTMKIMTAAMLISNGLASEHSPILCPQSVTWQSQKFHNLDNFSIPSGTLAMSFARSCNTAFIKPVGTLNDRHIADTALPSTAEKYFGIGKVWNTGISSFDGSVPQTEGPNTAAAMIGQGLVQMNPLNMASVTATARSGSFHQPVIVPPSMLDGSRATAQSLPYNTAQQLRDMMHITATAPYGTATVAMSGVGGYKGAKTGSAEVDAQGRSNSWFAGFSDDLAAAAVVQSGGHGGTAAGPVVAAVLRAG